MKISTAIVAFAICSAMLIMTMPQPAHATGQWETRTIRPTGSDVSGYYNCSYRPTGSPTTHYTRVDEETPNNDTDYIGSFNQTTGLGTEPTDLYRDWFFSQYEIGDFYPYPDGASNFSVHVYATVRSQMSGCKASFWLTVGPSWSLDGTYTWVSSEVKPSTTYTEIDSGHYDLNPDWYDMQSVWSCPFFGVRIRCGEYVGYYWGRCTQIYMNITYWNPN